MNTKNIEENLYLIRAIETIKRQIIVISLDFKILASSCNPDRPGTLPATSMNEDACFQLLYDRRQPCQNCPAREVVKTGEAVLKHINLDEDDVPGACLYAYPMDIPEKNERVIVVLDFDLPFLSKLDQKRMTSNIFMRNLINSAVDGVIAADMTGKLLIFNKAASEIAGYSKKEALEGLNIRNLYPPGDAEKIMKKMRSDDHGGKGKVRSHKQLALRKDNTTVPISLSASIVYEGEKEVASIGFFHDLTKAQRMQAELEKTQTQLLQAEKMSSLGKLAAGVAHQLNNPLGGITLFTQLMLEEHELSKDARNDLLRIQRDAERCSSIVKELLEFARQTKREVRLHNINKIVSRTLFLLRNQSIFQNIKITENYCYSLPDIPADIQQLNHVFMNIILNAADAMEGSGVLEITTSLNHEEQMVEVCIADSGPGIPEGILPSIFEPFFTTKEEGKGTGLGLSMAYGIVESHHGSIAAET